ncbi:Active breakpoint cluster regionrelated proteinlike, partial [Caligus rogercresseyi]
MNSDGESKLFIDFREAWDSRYPGSELPVAWEEDVRANLEKHESKVLSLREELQKEEMYVEYLNNLLVDIEKHRKELRQGGEERGDEEEESPFVTVINVSSPTGGDDDNSKSDKDSSSGKKPDFSSFQSSQKEENAKKEESCSIKTESVHRGQPDGHSEPRIESGKIKALRANWEKHLIPASVPEPLYDTVPTEEDVCYDNHLLYGGNSLKSDTLSSGDLGFEEELKSSSPLQSGTLSSSDTDGGGFHNLDDERNYVNIQYFLANGRGGSGGNAAASDDDELDESSPRTPERSPGDRVPPPIRARKSPSSPGITYPCVLNSVLDSESVYLEGLSVLLQYMKAMKVTLGTPNPVIPKEDFELIFYKIPELHELHYTFYNSLKKRVNASGPTSVGQPFKMLASRTKTYAAFLKNYPAALSALHRSTETYPQFADLTRSIKLRSVKGLARGQVLSLEELLHKPVARVQKHCLCLQDLIKYSPADSPDLPSLQDALQTVQGFLNDYNVSHAGELFPHQERMMRHLVKNSFIVELFEGSRKLRHLFLFNDVLVCAKYKASGGGRNEKFTFQLKWYIPLAQ